MRRVFLSATACALALSAPASELAAKPARPQRPACGISYLPLVPGTTWVYEFVQPPELEEAAGPRTEPPSTLEIEVVEVAERGGQTTISLEERYRDVAVKTQLRCDRGSLTVPPESFFFAGEPGGGRGMTFEIESSEGQFYPGRGSLKAGDSFYVALKGRVARPSAAAKTAAHAVAHLEIERKADVGETEEVETSMGPMKARSIAIVLSGRAAVEPAVGEPVHMPETRSELLFVDDVGLVRAYNRLAHGWQLSEVRRADASAP